MFKRQVLTILAVFALSGFTSNNTDETGFAFLSIDEDVLTTTHGLSYQITSDNKFKLVGPVHRSADFNDVPFDISLAAFVGKDKAVMVHAERVADRSGAANYTHFPETEWPDGNFRLKPAECFDLPPEAVEGEHDLEWLRDNGFSPAGRISLVQYFASTADFNEEIVISFVQKTDSCDDAAANQKAHERMRTSFSVTQMD